MGETRTSVKDVTPDVGETFTLDENVVKVLPTDSRVIEVVSCGTAAWTLASRITVQLPGGDQKSYFLKFQCATEDTGRTAMAGEHQSMTEIYIYMLDLVSKSVACMRPRTWEEQ